LDEEVKSVTEIEIPMKMARGQSRVVPCTELSHARTKAGSFTEEFGLTIDAWAIHQTQNSGHTIPVNFSSVSDCPFAANPGR
jgi:hypothetical protein